MKPWHFRYARILVYVATAIAAAGIVYSCAAGSPDLGQTLVGARQLFGLWSLGFLLGSMFLGPLFYVLPWLPGKSSLLYARRAVGVSALLLALLHVVCYVWSLLLRHLWELYTPGALWVAGLALGVVVMADMVSLGVTSRDKSVKRMGGRRWKRLHSTVYIVLPLVLVHSLFVGADFGINHGPDVRGSPDAGAGITFLCISGVWFLVFLLRKGECRLRGARVN